MFLHKNDSQQLEITDNSPKVFYRLLDDSEHENYNSRLDINFNAGEKVTFVDLILVNSSLKQTINVQLNKNGAEFNYFALVVMSGEHKNSITLAIDHNEQHTKSTQKVIALLSGQSESFFEGKVHIAQKAKFCEAHQNYRGFLLSDDAKASVLPILEVLNQDVSASHGASIGDIEEQSIFYLRSRGVDEKNAKKLILSSYAMQIISQISDKEIYTKVFSAHEKSLASLV